MSLEEKQMSSENRIEENNLSTKDKIIYLKKECRDINHFTSYLKGQKDIIKRIRKMLPGINKKNCKRVVGAKPHEKKWELDARGVLKDVIAYIKTRDNLHDKWLKENYAYLHKHATQINKLKKGKIDD